MTDEGIGYLESIPWPEKIPQNLCKEIKCLEIYERVYRKTKNTILIPIIANTLDALESYSKMAHICGEISERDLDMILIKIGFTHLADSYPDIREKVMRELDGDEEETSPAP